MVVADNLSQAAAKKSGFGLTVPYPVGHEQVGGIGGKGCAGGQVVHTLLQNAHRLAHFFHTAAVPGVDVAIAAQGNFKIHQIIGIVGFVLAHIVIHARTAQAGTCKAQPQRFVAAQNAYAHGALQPDAVGVEQGFVLFNALGKNIYKFLQAVHKTARHVLPHAADSRVGQGKACAAQVFKQVEQHFALAEAVQKNRHGPNIQRVGGKPKQVRTQARHFASNGAYVAGAQRRFHTQQLFYRKAVARVVGYGGDVVEPVGEGEGLRVGEGFGHFFKATVQIAHLRVAAQNGFALKFKV